MLKSILHVGSDFSNFKFNRASSYLKRSPSKDIKILLWFKLLIKNISPLQVYLQFLKCFSREKDEIFIHL
jgi:hypothetical protein